MSLIESNSHFTINPILLSRAYRRAAAFLLNPAYEKEEISFPAFEEIYEEYCMLYIEDLLDKQDKETLRNLHGLFPDDYDVEKGFNPSDYGVEPVKDFFDYLLLNYYSFEYQNEKYHAPLQEVW